MTEEQLQAVLQEYEKTAITLLQENVWLRAELNLVNHELEKAKGAHTGE